MANLYLTEQGSSLKKSGERLIVEKEGQELLEIQCFKVDTVMVFGNIQITTQAVSEILEHGINLAFLTMSGKLKGQVTPHKGKNIDLRLNSSIATRTRSLPSGWLGRLWPARSGTPSR